MMIQLGQCNKSQYSCTHCLRNIPWPNSSTGPYIQRRMKITVLIRLSSLDTASSALNSYRESTEFPLHWQYSWPIIGQFFIVLFFSVIRLRDLHSKRIIIFVLCFLFLRSLPLFLCTLPYSSPQLSNHSFVRYLPVRLRTACFHAPIKVCRCHKR